MSAVAIIPARANSKRIAGKNFRLFHGKPIIVYSIDAARACGLFDRIIISTDSEEVAAIARGNGAEPWRRDAWLAGDAAGTPEVMGKTLFELGYMQDYYCEYACCLYATAPMMAPEDLKAGLRLLAARPQATYCFAMGTEPPKDAAQWYWAAARVWTQGLPLVTPDSIMFPVDERRVCDINTEADWLRAEQMYVAWRDGADKLWEKPA